MPWGDQSAQDELLRSLLGGLPPAQAALIFTFSMAIDAYGDALIAAERARCIEVAERHGQYQVADEIRTPK